MWYKKEDIVFLLHDKTQQERRIKCEYIDMPCIYHYSDDDF